MMEKKYKLTDDTIQYYGRTLYRIEALRELIGVEIGQKGGFVESEDNLSHEGNCWVCYNAMVFGNAVISEDAIVYDNAEVCGNAKVYGNARITGSAFIYNAEIKCDHDYIVFKNWWSSGRYFTWTKSNNMWSVGCFYGTGEELIAKAYKDSELSGREYERIVRYVEAINQPIKPAKSLNRIQRIVCKLFNIK